AFAQVLLFWIVGDIFPSERRTIFGGSVSLGIFYFRFGLFTCWSLLYFMVRNQREEAERDLRMLRAQMNPHLLTNALQHVITELEPVHARAAGMVQSLTNYFNYSLRHQKDDFVTMGEEWDALRDFIKLEENLFGSKVDIAGHVDPAFRNLKVPGIILQPLVENAVKYGLQFKRSTVSIRIEVSQRDSYLVMAVHNTGHWIKPDPNRISGGIGLDNLHRRLQRLYGRKHRIETLEDDGWVTVRITIPAKL
ncbi:MAG: histidine kinase, partial [Verrucomicrobia bacterium]|nr:histidine kinase [Verrucomicrobiota bacterium]